MLPVLIFDGRCGFCRIWIEYWRSLTGDRVVYAPSQEVGPQYPEIPAEEFKRAVWLVYPDGRRVKGAQAAFELMSCADGKAWLRWMYEHVPGFAGTTEAAYRFIAAHRDCFYWVTRILWGREVFPQSWRRSRTLFLRGLAVVYLIAFISAMVQIRGLIGEHGVAPVRDYLESIRTEVGSGRYVMVPTLAWLNSSDAALLGMCWAGCALAVALFAGIVPMAAAAGLFILYLSLDGAGQAFYSFQWDALLLETGFAAILLAPRGLRARSVEAPPLAAMYLVRFLTFRLMFESGLVKLLSGDINWRNLTALNFHYETQPLPTPLAWYAHHLPELVQKLSVALVFAVELVVPFLFFMPRRLRRIGAWITIAFQLLIALTGNYTFFNLLTIVLCVPLLDDRRGGKPESEPVVTAARGRRRLVTVIACVLAGIGLIQLLTTSRLVTSLPGFAGAVVEEAEILHVVNRYGLFAIMTTSRHEIVIEGSSDGENWQAYEFKYKPGDITRAPRWVAPFQPRLDWQMWFAALSNYRSEYWFSGLMQRLLEGSPAVLDLLAKNPFPGKPPQFVRAVTYDYHFSDAATKRRSGEWWTRQYLDQYFPTVSLRR